MDGLAFLISAIRADRTAFKLILNRVRDEATHRLDVLGQRHQGSERHRFLGGLDLAPLIGFDGSENIGHGLSVRDGDEAAQGGLGTAMIERGGGQARTLGEAIGAAPATISAAAALRTAMSR